MPTIGQLSELLTATMQDRSVTDVANNYKSAHPAWDLVINGNFTSQSGEEGGMILPVKGVNTATVQASDRSGSIAVPVTENNIGAAIYDFANPEVGQVRLRWIDEERNSGKNAVINRLKSHREDLEIAQRDSISEKLHQLHTDRAANDPLSFDSLTNADVTTIGGIDSSAPGNDFWTPLTIDATGKTDAHALLRDIRLTQQRRAGGAAMPKVFLADENFYRAVLEYLDDKSSLDRVGGDADIEWESVKFAGTEIRFDWDNPVGTSYFFGGEKRKGMGLGSLHMKYLNGLWMKHLSTDRVDEVKVVSGVPTIFQTQDWSYKVGTLFSLGTNERRVNGQIQNFGL